MKPENTSAYRQVSKFCEVCKSTTPHQVRENDGVVAKICVACLLRGYLTGNPQAVEQAKQNL